MDTIITKLSEIESSANAIIQHTDVQKKEYEQVLLAKKEAFDSEVSTKTNATIQDIKVKLEATLETELSHLKEQHAQTLHAYNAEYEEYHEAYIVQILKNITEV
ncbi:MAG: hypothetical protein R3Y58_03730 [Eubacteriales bacterium]